MAMAFVSVLHAEHDRIFANECAPCVCALDDDLRRAARARLVTLTFERQCLTSRKRS